MTAGAPATWLLERLVCPVCRRRLTFEGAAGDGLLVHTGGACRERYPVMSGIPRLLRAAGRARLVKERSQWFMGDEVRRRLAEEWRVGDGEQHPDGVVAGFDFEWSRFPSAGSAELSAIWERYFDLVPADLFGPDRVVLDAGCGAGRWSLEVVKRGPRVIAVDLGLSVEVAQRNTEGSGRVACVQADVRDLPLADRCVDWAYSLGVIHHLPDPEAALTRLRQAIGPDGLLLVYLYYALDGRGPAYRALFRVVDALRHVVSRAPRVVVLGASTAIALLAYLPLARLSRLLARLGARRLANSLPLSFYRDLSLRVMLNDSLDRFGTRLERRYTRQQLVALMLGAGLVDIAVSRSEPCWHAIGRTSNDGGPA